VRTRLSFIAGGIVVTLALFASGAQATGGGRAASACSNERIGNATTGEDFYAFVLHGKVTCSQGHSLMRSYFRTVAAGRCPRNANICPIKLAGDWECSLRGAASERFDAGCFRGAARVQVYVVSPPASTRAVLHLPLFGSPDKSTLCFASTLGNREVLCGVPTGPESASHSGVVRGNGRITVCNEPLEASNCLGADSDRFPVLRYGQQTELGGIRCVSATDGITCTVVAGTGKGKGFRINKDEAVQIG
jgi:hypothetical protein